MSRGILFREFCPGGFCLGGFCPDTYYYYYTVFYRDHAAIFLEKRKNDLYWEGSWAYIVPVGLTNTETVESKPDCC